MGKEIEDRLMQFLDKYLSHLERKDAHDGATKWVMLAAMAAVAWQLSSVFKDINLMLALQLLAGFLIFYYICEQVTDVFNEERVDHKELRLLSRNATRPAEAKYLCAVLARYLLTAALFIFCFRELGGVFVWVAVAPLFVFILFQVAILYDIRKEYDIRKRHDFSVGFRLVFFLIFVLPALVGVIGVVTLGSVFLVLAKLGTKDVQAVGLFFVLLNLVERYARASRVDGEAQAVRKIWKRYGIGEIDGHEAGRQLRLTIAGASLNEVIGAEINEFTENAVSLEKMCVNVSKEVLAYKDGSDRYDLVTKAALLNSLSERKNSVREALVALESKLEKISVRIQNILGAQEGGDQGVLHLKAELKASYKKEEERGLGVVADIDEVLATDGKAMNA